LTFIVYPIGREGYFYELYKVKNYVVAMPICSLFIPKRLDEILHFKRNIGKFIQMEGKKNNHHVYSILIIISSDAYGFSKRQCPKNHYQSKTKIF
jgi:hypothetical protein